MCAILTIQGYSILNDLSVEISNAHRHLKTLHFPTSFKHVLSERLIYKLGMCDFEMPPNVNPKVHCITIIVVLAGLKNKYIRFGYSPNKSFMEDNIF
jgi:hypothetical protein